MSRKEASSSGNRADLEAADWLIRRDRGLTPAEQDEFLQWQAENPAHAEWLLQHQQTWRTFDQLAQWRPEHSAEPNPDLLARPRPSRRWLWPAALTLAAAAAVAVAFLAPKPAAVLPPVPAPHVVQTYERRILEDGSVVELNRGAAIRVDYSAAERRVWLTQGEAHFTVAKNPARPFLVAADRVTVRAVGTAFNVRLGDAQVEVLVTEGKVRVNPAAGEAATTAVDEPVLHAGQRTVVPLTARNFTQEVRDVRPEEMELMLAWQPKLLDFSAVPLSEVAVAFNRCNAVKIVIADRTLDALPIVASFRSDNVEGFVRLLEATTDIRAERTGATITLRRAP